MADRQNDRYVISYQNIKCKAYLGYYIDVLMNAMASQITDISIVFSTVYSYADQRNLKFPRHWPLCGEFTGDLWNPRTKG